MKPEPISLQEVQRVAKLSRLTLTRDEEKRFAGDMGAILEHVVKLKELSVDDVPPTAHAVDLPTLLRDDVVHEGLDIDRALQNAPERIGDGFGVPKIIE
jgi:aspartyl-tRNA(Asn)/glutamyl-tRNA(Gln) amidotransferase subunit C